MVPRVVIHNMVSVDGRIDFWEGDIGLYYEIAGGFGADAVLSGSETILKALAIFEPEVTELGAVRDSPGGAGEAPQQRMVVVDSRGRVDRVHLFRSTPYWSDCTVLCSSSTTPSHLAYLREHNIDVIIAGEERVDLRAALEELGRRYGIRTVRVDSGGALNGALLRAGLVNEVSVLLPPMLVGREPFTSLIAGSREATGSPVTNLALLSVERRRGDHVWLRYEVAP